MLAQKAGENTDRSRRRRRRRTVLTLLAAFVLLCCALAWLLVNVMMNGMFTRAEPQTSHYWQYDENTHPPRSTVSFMSGDNRLTGYIYGRMNTRGLVVLAHGLGGGSDHYLSEITAFVEAGWRVFAYDATGSYASEGASTVGLRQSALDLESALRYAEAEPALTGLPLLLYGHSWGGYAVAAVLDCGVDIAAAVSVAGYDTPLALILEQGEQMAGRAARSIEPLLRWQQHTVFGADWNKSAVEAINAVDTPVMIVHGSEDAVIPVDGSAIYARRAALTNPNVRLVLRDAPGRNGHETLVLSQAAADYRREANERYGVLYERYDGAVPAEQREHYYAGLDKALVNELDEDYIRSVDDFFMQALHG